MKAAGTRQYKLHSWLRKSFRLHIARCETFMLSIQQSALPIWKAYRSSYNITADEIHLWAHTSPISVHLHLNNFNCFIYFLTELFVLSQSWQRQSLNCCGALLSQAAHLIFSTGCELWADHIRLFLACVITPFFCFVFVCFFLHLELSQDSWLLLTKTEKRVYFKMRTALFSRLHMGIRRRIITG